MPASSDALEILDLRHFSAGSLRPLLTEETGAWDRQLLWNYAPSVELLLGYIQSRALTGYVATRRGRVEGYAFGVCEAAKVVLGDVFAFGEGNGPHNPVCERLLDHLLETMQAFPGVERAEAQLLLFPSAALSATFHARGFHSAARCFMLHRLGRSAGPADPSGLAPGFRAEGWRPEAYLRAAELIRDAYAGHPDSHINDQYRTVAGAQRFLHNIIYFPGCGTFDPANSLLLWEPATGELAGMLLCSRVRSDAVHITQLCVRPRMRGLGLGSALLAQCLHLLRRQGLENVSLTVTENNAGAMRLYTRHGFHNHHRFDAWTWQR